MGRSAQGDEHGVAITLKADGEGVPYDEYVARWRDEIKRTFDALGIEWGESGNEGVSSERIFEQFDRDIGARVDREEDESGGDAEAAFASAARVLGSVA